VNGGGTLPVVLLAIIAGATLLMALIQLAVVIVAARLGRQLQATVTRLEQDVRPVIASAASAADHASRAAALAAAQAERADRVLGDLASRIDDTAARLQRGLLAPAREGRAVLAGLQAAVGTLFDRRGLPASQRAGHDDDPLFIG
jgi:outer membrane murein-binding lipoprotein Lpp